METGTLTISAHKTQNGTNGRASFGRTVWNFKHLRGEARFFDMGRHFSLMSTEGHQVKKQWSGLSLR